MITERWQYDICIRDRIEAMCLISAIANHLYPDLPIAADREQRLLEIPEMVRLKSVLAKKSENLRKEIDEWIEKNK